MSRDFTRSNKSYKLAIDIGEGNIEPLDFDPTQDPTEVASQFCKKYLLPPDANDALTEQLMQMS